MPCCALCKALSGEYSEGPGHVLQLPLSFFVGVVEDWEAGEGVAARCELVCHGGFLFDFFLVFLTCGKVGDGGGCEGRHG